MYKWTKRFCAFFTKIKNFAKKGCNLRKNDYNYTCQLTSQPTTRDP